MVKAKVKEMILPTATGKGIDLQAGVSLQAAMNENTIDGIQTEFKKASRRVFELTWQGAERTPRGTMVLGKEIGFTQSGIVSDPEGNPIGTYERIQDGTGKSDDQHKMVVYLHPKEGDASLN